MSSALSQRSWDYSQTFANIVLCPASFQKLSYKIALLHLHELHLITRLKKPSQCKTCCIVWLETGCFLPWLNLLIMSDRINFPQFTDACFNCLNDSRYRTLCLRCDYSDGCPVHSLFSKSLERSKQRITDQTIERFVHINFATVRVLCFDFSSYSFSCQQSFFTDITDITPTITHR